MRSSHGFGRGSVRPRCRFHFCHDEEEDCRGCVVCWGVDLLACPVVHGRRGCGLAIRDGGGHDCVLFVGKGEHGQGMADGQTGVGNPLVAARLRGVVGNRAVCQDGKSA